MRHLRIWINLLVMLLPLLLLGLGAVQFTRGVFAYLNSNQRLAGTLSAEATRALGREVRIGDVQITGNLWGLDAANKVELRDVYVANGVASNSGAFVRANRVTVWYKLRQILEGKDPTVAFVDEVALDTPQLLLTRDAGGHWNYEQFIKPGSTSNRPFLDKLTFSDATFFYSDQRFPHPPGVPLHAFSTRLDHLKGVALVRPDKSVAFEVQGAGQPDLVGDFHSTGILNLTPLRVETQLTASQLNLPGLSRLFLPPAQGRLSSGRANGAISLLYAPSEPSPRQLDMKALSAHGTLQISNVTAYGDRLGAPLENWNGTTTFTTDSAQINLSGRYAGTPIKLNGTVLGVALPPLTASTARSAPPTVSLQGSIEKADIERLIKIAPVAKEIARLAPAVRADIRQARGRGNIQFQVAGPIDNPTATVNAQLETAQYAGFRGDSLTIHALYAGKVLQADVRGKYAGGDAAIQGKVALDKIGAFEAVAHGKGLALDRLGFQLKQPLTGTGQLDFAIRGQKGRTPNISAQAQIENAAFNGQSLHSVYAKVDTVGRDLVLRTLRAEDVKGFALASGTMNLKTQELNIDVEADEIDLGAIARAVGPKVPPLASGKVAPFDPSVLNGFGYLRGKLTGTLQKPELGGKLSAFGLQAGQVELDKVTADFQVSTHEIVLHSAKANRYPGEASLSGSILEPFSAEPRLALAAGLRRLDVRELLHLAGIELKNILLTGTISTAEQVQIQGTLNSLRIPEPFTIRLHQASINGLPIENASVRASYQQEGVRIERASAQVAGGSLMASGWFQPNGLLDLTLHGDNLSLEPIEEALPGNISPIVNGVFAFDARVSGTMQNPVGTVRQLSATDLTYNSFKIGSLQASAQYADKKIRLQQLAQNGPNPQDGSITIPDLVYDLETKRFQTSSTQPIAVNGIPVQRVRELVQNMLTTEVESLNTPDAAAEDRRKSLKSVLARLKSLPSITGPLYVTAVLGGTLEHLQADISWETREIRVENYAITDFSGSAYIDQDRVIVPSPAMPSRRIRLETQDGLIETPSDSRIKSIVVEYQGNIRAEPKPEYAGAKDIKPDLSASNLNLAFLQKFLDPRLDRKIEGNGDLGLTIIGKTQSPEIELSLNLQKVAYLNIKDVKKDPFIIDRISLDHALIREGMVEIDSFRVIKNDPISNLPYTATASGALKGFTWTEPFIPNTAVLSMESRIPIQIVGAIAPQTLRNSQGTITVNASVSRLRSNPSPSGSIVMDVPQLQFTDLATGLKNLKAEFQIKNDRLIVSSFQAVSQVYDKKGQPDPKKVGDPITLEGSIPFGFAENAAPNDTEGLRLATNRFYFDETPLPKNKTGSAKGSVRLDVKLTGLLKDFKELKLVNNTGPDGKIQKVVIYDTRLEPARSNGPLPALPLPPFDLAIQLGKNVRLNSSQLDARLSGDIVTSGRYVTTGNLANPKLEGQTRLTAYLDGTIALNEGTLKLPTTKFTILPGGTLRLSYPVFEPGGLVFENGKPVFQTGQQTLGVNVDLKARGKIVATSLSGVRKQYTVTVTAHGPLTGQTVDPATGQTNLALNFETSPNDLAGTQAQLVERLAPALIGVDSLQQAGRTPGQALANVLTGVFTGSVLPGIFDKFAASAGFEELSVGYDPIQHLTLSISRRLFGPLYVSYYRTLNAVQERYDLKFSLRFKDRYQISYDVDEQHTSKILLEGIWKF